MVASSLEPLAEPRLRPLWSAVHRRLEETGGELAGVRVHLRGLGDEERMAVDRLLGVRSRGATLQVGLERLDSLLRDRVGVRLLEVVTSLVGPVRDRPGERAAAAGETEALWRSLVTHPALGRHPGLEAWLESLRRRGSWRRVEAPQETLRAVLDVLAQLPVASRRGRADLAAAVLGDAHALDDQSPVGRLVVGALAALAGAGPALRASERRRLWAEQGVVTDLTSSTVLTSGLWPIAVGPLTEAAGQWASAGIPLPIPLGAVQAERWRVPAATLVSVCENPSVLAAAAGASLPVVCVEGQPSVAATLLLESLVEGGATLRYHGDFGAGGLAIANAVIGGIGAEPWRFSASDHARALDRARAAGVPLRALRGPVPEAVWDAALAPSVRAAGVEVEEELVIDELLEDLGLGAVSRAGGGEPGGRG